MLSADYDGHGQTLGTGIGIKNADPNMTVVMSGLENADLDYIRDMVTWFQANRPANAAFGQIPLDVINIHRYLGNNPIFNQSTSGVSPEEGGLKATLEEFVA